MAQRTPGPWHRNVPPATKYVTIFRGRNTHVCDVLPARGIPAEEAEANLTLIAAAPDLLAALRDAVFALEWHVEKQGQGVATDAEILRRARAIIAKAEGA